MPAHRRPQSAAANLLVGAASGTLAATVCYPLDTVRRRMQLRGHGYHGQARMGTLGAGEGGVLRQQRWRRWQQRASGARTRGRRWGEQRCDLEV